MMTQQPCYYSPYYPGLGMGGEQEYTQRTFPTGTIDPRILTDGPQSVDNQFPGSNCEMSTAHLQKSSTPGYTNHQSFATGFEQAPFPNDFAMVPIDPQLMTRVRSAGHTGVMSTAPLQQCSTPGYAYQQDFDMGFKQQHIPNDVPMAAIDPQLMTANPQCIESTRGMSTPPSQKSQTNSPISLNSSTSPASSNTSVEPEANSSLTKTLPKKRVKRNETEEEHKNRTRESNKEAARRCRAKKTEKYQSLEQRIRYLEEERRVMWGQLHQSEQEVFRLRCQLGSIGLHP